MFDSNVKDIVDKKIALLREVRDLFNNDRKLYKKIKALPMKSRVMRDTGAHRKESLVYVSSSVKTEFYRVTDTGMEAVDFLTAAAILKAKPEERPVVLSEPERHYRHVEKALGGFVNKVEEARDDFHVDAKDLSMTAKVARKFLVTVKQLFADDEMQRNADLLLAYVTEGKYARLPRRIKELAGKYKNIRKNIEGDEYVIQSALSKLVEEYKTTTANEHRDAQVVTEPRIIISETFNEPSLAKRAKLYIPSDYGYEADNKIHILVEFDNKAEREDDLFNALAERHLVLANGKEIDFNPIKPEKSGTIEQYLDMLNKTREENKNRQKRKEDYLSRVKVTSENFREVFNEVIKTPRFKDKPLEAAGWCFSKVSKENKAEVGKWLSDLGCGTKKDSEKLFNKWNKESKPKQNITKTKSNEKDDWSISD